MWEEDGWYGTVLAVDPTLRCVDAWNNVFQTADDNIFLFHATSDNEDEIFHVSAEL